MVMTKMKTFIDFIKNNKIFKILYNLLKTVIYVVLAVYLGFVIYQRFTGNAPLFGYRVFTVASGSMSPLYNINDVILVKEVDPKTLKVGDDIAYRGERGGFEGLIITHRIIKIEEDNYGGFRLITKGISNEMEDPSIDEDQILGKVCGKVFFINALNHVVKNIWGFFFLIFLPLSLIIILEVIETIFEGKIERNEIRKYTKNKTLTNETNENEEEILEVIGDDEEPSIKEDDEDEQEII